MQNVERQKSEDYFPEYRDAPLLVIAKAGDTSKLEALLKTAQRKDHHGGVWLYHDTSAESVQSLQSRFKKLMPQGLMYFPCVNSLDNQNNCLSGPADQNALFRHGDLKGWVVYVFGSEELRQNLSDRLQLRVRAFH